MEKAYEVHSDEAIISMIRQGDDMAMEYLMKKYNPLVKREARTMYLLGGDNEDLIQEGMIGLFQAIRDFDVEKNAKFLTFAKLCVDRKIYSAVTKANRKKNDPLNNALSLEVDEEDEKRRGYTERMLASDDANPEMFVLEAEKFRNLESGMQGILSKLEYEVISYYREGLSYTEIAARMEKTPKMIDNAIQRARGKISKLILNRDELE